MANTNSIPWSQTPDYLNMSCTQPQPGDMTAYDPPRRTGASPSDVTTIQQRSGENRERFSIVSWRVKVSSDGRDSQKSVVARLTQQQIRDNTTRGTTPGLINPLLPDTPENRMALPGSGNQGTIPSSSTSASRPSHKRKAVTSSRKADTNDSSDSDFDPMNDEGAEPFPRSKRPKKAASNLQEIYVSSSSSSFSSSPSYSTPSQILERGSGKAVSINRSHEAARLEEEQDRNNTRTTTFEPPSTASISYGKKRKLDPDDDYSDSGHDSGSLKRRSRRLGNIGRRSTSTRKNPWQHCVF